MSKTKFLGIPEGGKRAGWIEMEGGGSAGGGGGAFIVNLWHSWENGTWTSDKTAEEIVKAVRRGEIVQCVETNDDGTSGTIWRLQTMDDYVDISSMVPDYVPSYHATFYRFEVYEGNCSCQFLTIGPDNTVNASKRKTFTIEDE